ncbi:hypothetical protein FH972_023334 [Carpinus fangiana]|uniref:IST1-like protein n=1 Tax=Carpinus fangiana TaxID=176857 RepID=A0A5N6KUX1_9ROSI|nr:hypothetical protein FH972_023334 [Carpinus fangiana]
MAPPITFTTKLKVHLKTAIARLRIVQAKDTAVAKQSRREMATLLETGRVESARIRVENIIRADLTTELYEMLELYCELLLARLALLDRPADDGVDPGLDEAVRGILYAAPRTDIKELGQARALLEAKYGGKDKKSGIVGEAMAGEGVSERVRRKLATDPPRPELVEEYLRAIASAYDVPYGEKQAQVDAELEQLGDDDDDEDGEGGGQKAPPLLAEGWGAVSPPQALGAKSPLSVAPPSPSTERPSPKVKGAGGQDLKPSPRVAAVKKAAKAASETPTKARDDGKKKPEGEIPNVDDLAARFAMLKK